MSSSVAASCNLRVLLFGASGRTGQLLLDEALQRGHCVTAFVRNPLKLKDFEEKMTSEKKERFKLAGGSVMNGEEVEKVIRAGFDQGKPFDAVLSTLTSDEKPHNTCSVSSTYVLETFRKIQEERKSSSSSSASASSSPFRYLVVGGMLGDDFVNSRSFFEKLVLKPAMWFFGASARDRQKELSLFETASSANPDWRLVMVAPPFLTNGPLTAKYATDSKNPGVKVWSMVSRRDVAHYMLRLAEESDEQVKTHTEGHFAPLYNP